MKTLANQLREQMGKRVEKPTGDVENSGDGVAKKAKKKPDQTTESTILKALLTYDTSDHKSMVHTRFDKQTVDIMNKFKMATGVDVTKFVAFAVRHFFESNPELKIIIKQFIQNTDL